MTARRVPIWAIIALTSGLGACSSDIFSRDNGGLQKIEFFKLRDDSRIAATTDTGFDSARALSAEDYVDGSGLCSGMSVAAPADANAAEGAATPASLPPAPAVVGGVSLGMSECDVVRRAGQPAKVEIGGDAADRTAVLTYPVGAWPGIYRFSGGRLKEIERVAAPPPPPKPVKTKKAVKPKSQRPPA